MADVSVRPCAAYEYGAVKEALSSAIAAVGGLDFLKPGDRVILKANLVAAAAPDSATTTHPTVLAALTELLSERGASVVIGDSPGGLYAAAFVERVYRAAHLEACEAKGAILNRDFSEATATYPEAKVAKTFTYTAYLDHADYIVDVCKLKTHGMMGLSCAAKNMFGAIPGTVKPEYHFRYPDYESFADMILDLDAYFKPVLSICDGIVGMEGNGPTAGTPRPVGCVLASCSPHALDLVAAGIIGLSPESVPTLSAAMRQKLIPPTREGLSIDGDPDAFYIPDYKNLAARKSLVFRGASDSVLGAIFGGVAKRALDSKPKLKKKLCVGCNKCGSICPAKAITMVKGKAVIDREKCIRCFCCQEFCPKGAMRVHRTFIARILDHK